jgi:hypothetical protein
MKKKKKKTEVDTESYMDKLQSKFKNLDLNRMTSGNHNDQGRTPRIITKENIQRILL